VAGLASHLESDTIGGGVLELEGGGREVVEVLVEKLQQRRDMVSIVFCAKHASMGSSR
jgi:hypothetical protein